MIRLSQKILLLALDNSTGGWRPVPERSLDFALAGALIMELIDLGRLSEDLQKLAIIDDTPMGAPILDRVLEILQEVDKDTTLKGKIIRIAREAGSFRNILIDNLVEQGILRREEQRRLIFLTKETYPIEDTRPEERVKDRLRAVIDGEEAPNMHDIVLLSLVDTCRLLDVIFTEDRLEEVRDKIHELVEGNALREALVRAMQQVQTALLAVIAGPVT